MTKAGALGPSRVDAGSQAPEGLGVSQIKADRKTDLIPVRAQGSEEVLDRAGALIRQGELVVFPTETVYGLGADGLNPEAVRSIFRAKGRPSDNPLILHIADFDQVPALVDQDLTPFQKLMEDLWPGPMTLVFRRSSLIPDQVTAGGDTVGIRMPSHPIGRAFLRSAQRPVAAPSANLSGRPSPTNAQDVYQDMAGRLPLILDGGPCDIGIESTVVDLTVEPAQVLRPGFYTPEILAPYLPGVALDPGLGPGQVLPKSPGQKYKHYAPRAEMTLFVDKSDSMEKAVRDIVTRYLEAESPDRVGLLLFEENVRPVREAVKAAGGPEPYIISQGSRSDLSEMGHSLFTNLRRFDMAGMAVILAMGVPPLGYGESIMNRMRKAAAGRVIEE